MKPGQILSLLVSSLFSASVLIVAEDNSKIWQSKSLTEISNLDIGEYGKLALEIEGHEHSIWKHAETEHWIVHYQRESDIANLARELEFYTVFMMNQLNLSGDEMSERAHVFVFRNDDQWEKFTRQTKSVHLERSIAFCYGQNMYLQMRGKGPLEARDSWVIAHEACHSVVHLANLVNSMPVWMVEGYAEYVGTAASSEFHGGLRDGKIDNWDDAQLDLKTLLRMGKSYATVHREEALVTASGREFVRFLIESHGLPRFRQLIRSFNLHDDSVDALLSIYGNVYPDFETLSQNYEAFQRAE